MSREGLVEEITSKLSLNTFWAKGIGFSKKLKQKMVCYLWDLQPWLKCSEGGEGHCKSRK